MKITNLTDRLARRLGRVAKKATATAGPAILAGGLFFTGAASGEVLFSENFENLVLMEAVSDSENWDFGEVWTDVPPAGWVRDNDDTPPPDPDDPTDWSRRILWVYVRRLGMVDHHGGRPTPQSIWQW